MPDFNKAINYVLMNEGGFVNNPDDPGGITNYGITANSYAEFKGHPMDEFTMRMLGRRDAERFYLTRFWKHYGLDEIYSQAVATALLDVMVNLGPVYAARFAQTICAIEVDGLWGKKTVEAVNKMPKESFVEKLVDCVENRYRSLIKESPELKIFANGWLKRAERLLSLVAE